MKEYIEISLEMRGMHRSEIVNYFISIGGNPQNGCKLIVEDWVVELCDAKTVTLGVIKIPSTRVIFRGNKDAIEGAVSAFRLRFLSAGG
jgi:hypothetical protein